MQNSAILPSSSTHEPVRFLDRPDARIRYTRAGAGPAVLFVQGVGVVGEGWRPQLDGLCDRFTVLAFDNRGLGGSTTTGPITIEAMASDALAILDAEGFHSAHLVGHSMGGIIAQAVAFAAPDRVRSLSFLCTFAAGQQGARLTFSTLLLGLRSRIGTRRMRRHAFLDMVMPKAYFAENDPAAVAERLRPLFGRDLADSPPEVMKQLRAMGRYDARERLPTLARIPTLVVSASLDKIALPRYGRELAETVPGARYVEIPAAGHGLPIHLAAETNQLLTRHLDAADADRARAARGER